MHIQKAQCFMTDCSEDKSILKDYINQPINDAFT